MLFRSVGAGLPVGGNPVPGERGLERVVGFVPLHLIGALRDDLDNPEDIQARVLEIEHRILPKAVALYCNGKIVVENERAKVK